MANPPWPNLLWGRDRVGLLCCGGFLAHIFCVHRSKSWCAGVRDDTGHRVQWQMDDESCVHWEAGGWCELSTLMVSKKQFWTKMHRAWKHLQIRLKNISSFRQHLILIFVSFWICFGKSHSRSRRDLLRAGALCCSPGWGCHKGTRFRCPQLPSGLTCCTPGLVLEGSQSLLISADQYLVPEVCAFHNRTNPWGSCCAARVSFPAQQQNCSGSSAFQEFLAKQRRGLGTKEASVF